MMLHPTRMHTNPTTAAALRCIGGDAWSRGARGFTLVEMALVVAILVLLLGLMTELASSVRRRSARELTEDLLGKLEAAMGRYVSHSGGYLPDVHPLLAAQAVVASDDVEEQLQRAAKSNNADFTRALRGREDLTGKTFADLPVSIYDERSVRDAWGNPIVFMPRMHPQIGMAPDNRPFFFSPGPDGRYLTRADNLYSYEIVPGSP
jgi:prepilin-type N-terminal cleavage/methylation domain-containing protein